ncbi:MAG TPA: glycosyltransferase 87 family protein [Vicinamibacterales bacterium]|nr:glycosyltransferase 87 family protein [Vicinamibacterales bacterium]
MRSPLVLIAVLIIHLAAFGISVAESAQPAGDFDRYYEIASGAGRPYIDYQVEHPIATLLVFKALARLPGGRASFGLGVVVLDLIAGAIIVGSLLWGWGIVSATIYAAAVAPILGLFFNRVDAWSTAAAILAVAAWRKNRPITLGCALAIGAAFKLWPLVLGTLLVVPWRARRSLIALTAFAVTAAVFASGALWLAGSRGVLQVLTFRGATGWQIESLIGSLVHLTGSETMRMESGAWRIGTISSAASIAMFAAAAPICVWSSWRGARLDRVGAGWLGSVSTLLVLSALLSPQYVIWLAPAAGIAWVEGDTGLAVITAIAILLTQIFWSFYGSVLGSELPALLTVVLRNAVLIVLAVSAIARLRTVRKNREDRGDR